MPRKRTAKEPLVVTDDNELNQLPAQDPTSESAKVYNPVVDDILRC